MHISNLQLAFFYYECFSAEVFSIFFHFHLQDVTCTATHARPEGTFHWYLKVMSNGIEEKRETISVNPDSATTKQEFDGLVTTSQVKKLFV